MSASEKSPPGTDAYRRRFLARLGAATLAAGTAGAAWNGRSLGEAFADFFQQHYTRMTADEVAAALARIERKAERRHGADITCKSTPAQPGVVFGYAINISKCRGYRDCVYACQEENNLPQDIQYIRVLEIPEGSNDLHEADHYYDHASVPRDGHYYLPMQCMQCDDPPCVKACPIGATWKEADGIVVVDYDWCFGCRYCMTACPYSARFFNWSAPQLATKDINPDTHYLGNRPRPKGVVEKCHFCVQRTREGRQPACQEACPTGARIFGNLLDPNSEIRYLLKNKTVFRLKEDLGTEPKFWYFRDD